MNNRTIDAIAQTHRFATEHNLPAYRVDVHGGVEGGSWEWNPETGDWDLPGLPSVSVALNTSAEFIAWFRAVGMTEIQLTRRDVDTCINAHVRHEGIRWSFWGSLERPKNWRSMPIRPSWGDNGSRNEASVTLAEFESLAPLLDRPERGA